MTADHVSPPLPDSSSTPDALLDSLPLPSPNAELDQVAWDHLTALLKQSLAPKLSEAIWLEPITSCLHLISATLTPSVLTSIAESLIAQQKVASTSTSLGASPDKETKSRKGKEKEKDSVSIAGEASLDLEHRRTVWREAREFLLAHSPSSSPESDSIPLPTSASDSEISVSTDDTDTQWTNIASLPKLVQFRLTLKTTTATLGAVKGGLAQIGVKFETEEWLGRALFGRDALIELEEEDLRHLSLIGGTLHLTCTSKDCSKLERILELLCFAVLTLKLESSFLHDTQCPRPSSAPEDDVTNEEDERSSVRSGSTLDSAKLGRTRSQSITSSLNRSSKEHKSRWSKPGLWSFLTGSHHHPLPSLPTDPAPNHRGVDSDEEPDSDSPILSGSSTAFPSQKNSHSKASSSTADKVRDKLKGAGLKFRRTQSKHSDRSDGTRKVNLSLSRSLTSSTGSRRGRRSMGAGQGDGEVQLDTWDFIGGLGLGLGLRGLRPGHRESRRPSASASVSEQEDQVSESDGGKKKSVGCKKGETPGEEPTERFQRVIKQMEKCLLSVSPNVVYPPPHLLVRLRQQEVDQLAGSTSFPPSPLPPPSPSFPPADRSPDSLHRPPVNRSRSFPTIDAQTLAMGFASGHAVEPSAATQTTMASTTSRATRITLDARAGLASLMTNNNSLGGTIRHQGMQFLVETACKSIPTSPSTNETVHTQPCKSPKWLGFNYFSSSLPLSHASPASPNTASEVHPNPKDHHQTTLESCLSPDVSLGQMIEQLVDGRKTPCATPTCKKPGEDHVLHWMHSKERISISISSLSTSTDSPPAIDPSRPRISTWTTCRTCNAKTSTTLLSLTTYLFSFAKFAELLMYDPEFVPFPELCEHAGVGGRDVLVRSFETRGVRVDIELDQIELFELRLPTSVDPDILHEEKARESDSGAMDGLKQEIYSYYRSLRDRMDLLSETLDDISEMVKRDSDPDSGGVLAPGPMRIRSGSEATIGPDAADTTLTMDADGTLRGTVFSTSQLLQRLRDSIEDDEVDLLEFIESVPVDELNNGRWHFMASARAGKARLESWEDKHAAELDSNDKEKERRAPFEAAEPEYFKPTIHVFPVESSVLVREDELSSAIALTLSAKAFQDEVSLPSVAPLSRRVTPSFYGTPTPSASRKSSRQPIPMDLFESTVPPAVAAGSEVLPASESVTPPRSPRPASTAAAQTIVTPLDPDDPSADFSILDDIECIAKPKKVGRSGSSIMHTISRQPSSDSFGFFRSAGTTPTAEGSVLQEAQDKRKMLSDSMLEDLVRTTEPASGPPAGSSSSSSSAASSRLQPRALPAVMATVTKRHVSEPTTTSNISFDDVESSRLPSTNSTFSSTNSTIASDLRAALEFSGTPAKSLRPPSLMTRSSTSSLRGEVTPEEDLLGPLDAPEKAGTRLVNASLSLLSSMRRGPGFSSSPKGTAEVGAHIKFSFRHGDKKFRVTSYFAQRFHTLRTRCGLSENLFIESLARCHDLNPSGGKSKAAFWMTSDRRFMLKELTTQWGISEKDAFLSFAPRLLDYAMSPERPSLLAKIFGFYTVKVKDIKTGEIKKLDLVVMEHLFHSHHITRQFDLKGVASRIAKQKKKAGGHDHETGWDGDWLSGSLENRLLIYSHSKTLLRDALLNDSHFLSQCGNIDYSLLVGVDDTRKELVVGLIDTLGVFNTYKFLENKGKTALKRATASDADAVTVLPPSDYAARFRQGMEKYFVAVPEKFSKMQGTDELDPDPRLAPVV